MSDLDSTPDLSPDWPKLCAAVEKLPYNMSVGERGNVINQDGYMYMEHIDILRKEWDVYQVFVQDDKLYLKVQDYEEE